jgi:hypothetical protein
MSPVARLRLVPGVPVMADVIVRLGVLAVLVRGQLVRSHVLRIGPSRGRKPRAEGAVPGRKLRQGSAEHTMRKLAELPILACGLN